MSIELIEGHSFKLHIPLHSFVRHPPTALHHAQLKKKSISQNFCWIMFHAVWSIKHSQISAIDSTLTFNMCKFVESWKRANKPFDKFVGYFNFTRSCQLDGWKIVCLKFRYSEKGTKMWKKSPNCFELIKGQIMSECIYEIIDFPKYHQKIW